MLNTIFIIISITYLQPNMKNTTGNNTTEDINPMQTHQQNQDGNFHQEEQKEEKLSSQNDKSDKSEGRPDNGTK